PVPNSNNFSFFAGRILYNLGRIISYSLMGLMLGFLVEKFILAGYQQFLSILLGGVILLYLVLPKKYKSLITNYIFVQKVLSSLRAKINLLFRNKKNISFLAIGFLNGFFPCGFVYFGLAGALATGNSLEGMLFMFLFGMGTFPVMFAVSVFGKFISLNFRKRLTKLSPVFVLLFAVLFIVRGMNLGIPYLSPQIENKNAVHKIDNCCE
ncbi:MAG TPA: sulfite exporter TauE/SafE family protein, partial [Ignavibacteriaceae bacterium]|nr:sulfite exporter TauE/SafE family protein [Ignavibacteriaceae bacterium]